MRKFFLFLRTWRKEVTGDAAYVRYLNHVHSHHPGEPPLSREAFFRREQDRKWQGVRRCC